MLKLRFQYNKDDNDVNLPSVPVAVTVTTTEVVETGCPPVQVPAVGNWYDQYIHETNASIGGIECGDDNTDASTSFPRMAKPNDTNLANPKYTNNVSDPDVIRWNEGTAALKYIVPANYHDFRQEGILGGISQDDILSLDDFKDGRGDRIYDNATEYCNASTGHDGNYIEDIDNKVKKCASRMESMKKAMFNILTKTSDVNVGLARYNYVEGGSIIKAVENIADTRDELVETLFKMPADGATPIQETMYTAFRYFAGGPLIDTRFNKRVSANTDQSEFLPSSEWACVGGTETTIVNESGGNFRSCDVTKNPVQDITDPAAKAGGKFVSPVEGSCQDNSIILLSDGAPTWDRARATEIDRLSAKVDGCDGNGNGRCLNRLVSHMANNDVYPGLVKTEINGTERLVSSGQNKVYTYTVAFGSSVANSTFLKDASDAGRRTGAQEGSQYFTASTSDTLTTAFETILRDIGTVTNDSFVAPAVAVNAFNRLQFRDDLYFALFQPDNRPRWSGNIKKFKIDGSTGNVVDAQNPPQNAIGDDGFFLPSAVSYWGDAIPDGPEVLVGGVVSQLNVNPARQLYADLAGGSNSTLVKLDRSNFATQLAENNITNIGQQNFPDAAGNIKNIIDWTLGYEVPLPNNLSNAESNFYFGESLHSTPFVVDFGDQETPKDVLFVATNQGMLHAIDGDSGEEKWTYIPDPSLFPNLGAYYNNEVSDQHRYGLDSELAFEIDRNSEGVITNAEMFFGQRRGGNKYFALDITNAARSLASGAPIQKKWTIDSSTLYNSGQSWAKPVPATVNFCTSSNDSSCKETAVLFISGGYDPAYDDVVPNLNGIDQPKPLADVVSEGGSTGLGVRGNAIYMVAKDADEDRSIEAGDLLWIATHDATQIDDSSVGYIENKNLKHSFPAEPTVIDSDFDGIADFLFAVDIAGNVWRFDFVGDAETSGSADSKVVIVDENDIRVGNNAPDANNTNPNIENEGAGGIIAQLSPESKNRRFFNKLDVSLTPRIGNQLARFNLVTGSGNRASPIIDEAAENRLYFVFDRNVILPKFDTDNDGEIQGVSYNYKSATEKVASSDIKNRFSTTNLELSGDHKFGFFVPLTVNSSEKMLNPTLTEEGTVIAVSYSPERIVEDGQGNLCQKSAGSSSLYLIDLLDGSAARQTLVKSGISARPVVIEVADPDNDGETVKILIIGSESFDVSEEKVTSDDENSDIDKLETPGLNDSDVGGIRKVNWWERRQR